MSLGSYSLNFGYKSENHLFFKRGQDVRTLTREKVKARIGIEFSLFSFPFFLVLICMDSKKMMHSLSLMN